MSDRSPSWSEALHQDQRARWQRGEHVLVESYLERYPALRENSHVLLDLVVREYLLRQEYGESPKVDEYSARFPALRNELSQALSSYAVERGAEPHVTNSTPASALRTTPVECPHCGARAAAFDDFQRPYCPECQQSFEAPEETLPAPFRSGRMVGAFELLRCVGRGQFGEVWLARDNQLRREVAVKLPREVDGHTYQAELYLREARGAARLRHPNIVPVYEAGLEGRLPYIVTAFVPGANLKRYLERHKLTPRQAAELCRALAEALHHAHEAGIIHRDLKPSNILIDADGTPYLTDFGLAKHLRNDELTLAADGSPIGTPAYMPPEQARGESNQANAASDVYSLGVILYELLTGRRPFGGTGYEVVRRSLTEEPTPPHEINPSIPRDLETICLKAMAKAPADRYPTAKAMAEDLDLFARDLPIVGTRVSFWKRGWRRARRRWREAGAVAAACAVVGVLTGWGVSAMLGGREDSHATVLAMDSAEPEPPSADFTHQVRIVTDPPGAEVVCYLLDWETGRPDFTQRVVGSTLTPTQLELQSGMYLVVAHCDDSFHEVLRTVPRLPHKPIGIFNHCHWEWDAAKRRVTWPTIKLFPKLRSEEEELVPFEGAQSFAVDLSPLNGGQERWRIPPFELEATEVSIAEFERFQLPFPGHDGRAKNLAATNLPWELALDHAEKRGLRLPDLLEVEFVTTAGGTQLHPWGDQPPPANNWSFSRPVEEENHDRLTINPQVRGVASGPLEWTMTRVLVGVGSDYRPGLRYVVHGGPAAVIEENVPVGKWVSVNEHSSHLGLGLRCARSPEPRLDEEDFLMRLP